MRRSRRTSGRVISGQLEGRSHRDGESIDALSDGEEERQKSGADELRSRSLVRRSSPQSMRSFLACESAGNSTGGRAHSPTAMLWVFSFEQFEVVSSSG